MRTASDYNLTYLLELSGAQLVGRNRANCPRCGGKRTVSYTDQAFCCHHSDCGFKGNVFTLARELGLVRKLTPREVRELHQRRKLTNELVEWVYERLRLRRLRLYETHQSLFSIVSGASERLRRTKGQDEMGWSALAYAYPELDKARAQLLLIEDGPVQDALAFLDAGPAAQETKVAEIIRRGGLVVCDGKFLELADAPRPVTPSIRAPEKVGADRMFDRADSESYEPLTH